MENKLTLIFQCKPVVDAASFMPGPSRIAASNKIDKLTGETFSDFGLSFPLADDINAPNTPGGSASHPKVVTQVEQVVRRTQKVLDALPEQPGTVEASERDGGKLVLTGDVDANKYGIMRLYKRKLSHPPPDAPDLLHLYTPTYPNCRYYYSLTFSMDHSQDHTISIPQSQRILV
ncbi:hypothetical protein NM688_g8539 [Phlebia brevispora]|uniref:Uncharacterized protein n=1 Tax=Phlebia brevispora TaxID=194682 RepID=A0ACC1RTP9_9APHY|nr:hypothetical protein NM688_g8539 [Phlebia brevispora]